MTNEELAEIELRLEGLTAGPWSWELTGDKDNAWGVGLCTDYFGEAVIGEACEEDDLIDSVCYNDSGHGNIRDAIFIAHARTDIPRLLEEIQNMRDEDQERS